MRCSPKLKNEAVRKFSEKTARLFLSWKEKQDKDRLRHHKWGENNCLLKELPDPVFTTSTGMLYLPGDASQECARPSRCSNRLAKPTAEAEGRKPELIRIHPHLFRHLFITRCVESGMDPSLIKYISGHAEIEMTEHYAHPSEEYILKEYQAHYHKKRHDKEISRRENLIWM